MPQDLNFNSVLAVFLIKNKEKASFNVSGISHMLLESGIEVVTLKKRELDYREAVFLQSRVVQNTVDYNSEKEFNPERR